MSYEIMKLKTEDFHKCSNIWNMEKQANLAKQFYAELLSENRKTYVYCIDGMFVGEISLVYDMNDTDYTIRSQRVYVSRLIVKKEYRRQGIGRVLVDYACKIAKNEGFTELSIGVDLDNYAAIKLYWDAGFDRIIYVGEDEQGQYMKLLKK